VGGSSQSCYSGASSTKGVGACKADVHVCTARDWGPCSGEVTPKKEVCDKVDNDCDGKADEGDACCSSSCVSRDACGSDGCGGGCGSCDSDRVCHKGYCVWTHGHNGDPSVSCSTICAWGTSQCVDATTGGCGTKGSQGTCYCW
ncbi:MAG TPA: MopE-related protein, partial [Polyangiaceae bacterium]|nr:MopE-related protein [Polyangiaceae bacterium]